MAEVHDGDPKKRFGFGSFCKKDLPVGPRGAFRDNMVVFLEECTSPESYSVEGMRIWRTVLVSEDHRSLVVPLYTVEELVLKETTNDKPFCQHCVRPGWSHHHVSKRKYHMIIPTDDGWDRPLDGSDFHNGSHLLHGLIHCNGFAHLLKINGIRGGSKCLRGREIMDLWDRICYHLLVRQVSVLDLSKKRSMDLRLLHGVAYGHSWFSRWGYSFFRGSFGVKIQNYKYALGKVRSLELEAAIKCLPHEYRCQGMEMVDHYRKLSEQSLITVEDILKFMLTVRAAISSQKKLPVKFTILVENDHSRWEPQQLVRAAHRVVDILLTYKESNQVVTRKILKDSVKGHTGMVDHVLKLMDNVIVGNYIVCRAANQTTNQLEFIVDHLGEVSTPLFLPPSLGVDAYIDLLFLYERVLLVQSEAQIILHSKTFVKEFQDRFDGNGKLRRYTCKIVPTTELNSSGLPPGEVVIVGKESTFGDLKKAALNALSHTFLVTQHCTVTGFKGFNNQDDESIASGLPEGDVCLTIDFNRPLAFEAGSDTRFSYVGGLESAVNCCCGTTDDDGETLAECKLQKHPRCYGLDDTASKYFLCSECLPTRSFDASLV